MVGSSALLLIAVVALPQPAAATSPYDLKLASPLIHWPRGLEPRDVDVFVHNEGWIAAPPDVVWNNLIDAAQWPSWYSNSADIQIENGRGKLAEGVSFKWTTFGFSIESVVDTFVPSREIGWSVATPGFRVHHAWVLISERNGTRVVTEETQKGAAALKFRREQPNALFDGHDWWLSALKARAERADHR